MAENHKTAEPDDPLELVGMVVPVPPGYDSMAEMGRCFVEEFALMGWDRRRILRLFKSPVYAGAHAIYRARGEEFVDSLITQVLGPANPKEGSHA